jgi:hypothetical protein
VSNNTDDGMLVIVVSQVRPTIKTAYLWFRERHKTNGDEIEKKKGEQ